MADTPGNQAFVQNYKAAYGSEPGPWAAQAYATLHILANAIMNAQSTDSTAIRDALAQTMDFPTILGNFSFDPDGDAVYDPIVFIVKDGELQLFETAVPQTMHKEIPIGLVVPLTGSNAGPYGLSMQNGFELAREEINNTTLLGDASLTFMTEDSRTTEEGTIDAVQMFVDQGLPAIIGLASSAQLKKAYPIAHESGVVVFSSLSATAGLSALGDFLFRTGLATDILIPAGVMATQEKIGYKKAALIYDAADTYSTSSNEVFEKTLEAIGVEVLTVETFQTKATDFSEQLTNIMGMSPDALFISALAPEMTQIITQAQSIGIPDSTHLIVPDLTAKEIQEVGDAAEGAITFSGWTGLSNIPGNQAFIQSYQMKYGIEPGPWAAQAYATLHILANAIAKAQSPDAMGIRDALAQTMDFSTILGNFSFDPNGEAIYDPIVLIVKDGKLQVFE
jgi:branched-chain amino acid transport system substrate-binding protein